MAKAILLLLPLKRIKCNQKVPVRMEYFPMSSSKKGATVCNVDLVEESSSIVNHKCCLEGVSGQPVVSKVSKGHEIRIVFRTFGCRA